MYRPRHRAWPRPRGRRCTGVEYEKDGKVVQAKARETILSAGGVASPQILELSGIGQPERLKALASVAPVIGVFLVVIVGIYDAELSWKTAYMKDITVRYSRSYGPVPVDAVEGRYVFRVWPR